MQAYWLQQTNKKVVSNTSGQFYTQTGITVRLRCDWISHTSLDVHDHFSHLRGITTANSQGPNNSEIAVDGVSLSLKGFSQHNSRN